VAAKIHGSDTRAWNDGLARSNDAFIAWRGKIFAIGQIAFPSIKNLELFK
jgi:hypothetical protein